MEVFEGCGVDVGEVDVAAWDGEGEVVVGIGELEGFVLPIGDPLDFRPRCIPEDVALFEGKAFGGDDDAGLIVGGGPEVVEAFGPGELGAFAGREGVDFVFAVGGAGGGQVRFEFVGDVHGSLAQDK